MTELGDVEHGRAGRPGQTMTVAQARQPGFGIVAFRASYERTEVHDFVSEVIATLEEQQGG